MLLPIKISPNALEQIKIISQTKGITPDMGLRIGVRGSGCSGTSFMIGFDEKKDSDVEYLQEGLKILIEKKHFLYLTGMLLDFVDNQTQKGFTFVPNS